MAPAFSASTTKKRLVSMESARTRMSGYLPVISRVASMPFMTGMVRSMITRSGLQFTGQADRLGAIACLAYHPAVSLLSINDRKPSRKMGWSSTSRIFVRIHFSLLDQLSASGTVKVTCVPLPGADSMRTPAAQIFDPLPYIVQAEAPVVGMFQDSRPGGLKPAPSSATDTTREPLAVVK